MLAGLFWIAGGEPPVMSARLMNAVLGVLAVAGVMGLCGLLFDQRAAWIAGLATSLYPGAIAMSTFVLAEAPFCPLMILQLALWAVAWRSNLSNPAVTYAGLSGIAAGLATLMRPSWLLFTPLAIAIGFVVGPSRRRHVVVGAAMLIGLTLTMSPWWYRNWQVTGSFVPTTLQTGESLYDGLNPQATGASDMRFVDDFRARLRAADAAAGDIDEQQPCFEQRLDRMMRDTAIAWAIDNPGQVLRLAAVKFIRIWNVWPNEPSLRGWRMRACVALGFTPLLVLGIWGAWKYGRRGWPYVLCFLPAIYFTCLHMIFVGSIRYRQPAMLPLTVLAAGVLADQFWRKANR